MDFADFVGGVEDAFCEQEASGKLKVVAGSPHGDGDGLGAEANFEGFLNG
jgi:hypothetical protein